MTLGKIYVGSTFAQREGHLISSSKISASEVCQFGFVLVFILIMYGGKF